MTVLDRFSKNRNGKEALLALKATFEEKTVWENIIKYSEDLLENHKWTDTTDITLERYASGH